MFDVAPLLFSMSLPGGRQSCYRHIASAGQRMSCMRHYFGKILEGYRSETDVSEEMLEKLPLFIDMTIIEFVADEFECCAREGSEPDEEDIGNAVYCLVNNVPYGGFGEEYPEACLLDGWPFMRMNCMKHPVLSNQVQTSL